MTVMEQQEQFNQMVLSRLKEIAPDACARAEAEVNLALAQSRANALEKELSELKATSDPDVPEEVPSEEG